MTVINNQKSTRQARLILALLSGFAIFLNSCIKSPNDLPVDETSIDNMVISPNFKFITTQDVAVNINTR